ncbi:hypothetical protein D3C81_1466390 [compost metagenome]
MTNCPGKTQVRTSIRKEERKHGHYGNRQLHDGSRHRGQPGSGKRGNDYRQQLRSVPGRQRSQPGGRGRPARCFSGDGGQARQRPVRRRDENGAGARGDRYRSYLDRCACANRRRFDRSGRQRTKSHYRRPRSQPPVYAGGDSGAGAAPSKCANARNAAGNGYFRH